MSTVSTTQNWTDCGLNGLSSIASSVTWGALGGYITQVGVERGAVQGIIVGAVQEWALKPYYRGSKAEAFLQIAGYAIQVPISIALTLAVADNVLLPISTDKIVPYTVARGLILATIATPHLLKTLKSCTDPIVKAIGEIWGAERGFA